MNPADLAAAAESAQAPLDPTTIHERGEWAPRTISDVEFALECAAESESEIAALDASLKSAIARLEARADAIRSKARARADYFIARVAEFAQAHRSDILIGKKKSRDLLSGRIGWRKKGGKLTVIDKAALSDWLPTQDASLYRVKVEPEMKALQALAASQGIIPPGCEWEPERDEIYVEANPLPVIDGTQMKELP